MHTMYPRRHFGPVCLATPILRDSQFPLATTLPGDQASPPACAMYTLFPNRRFLHVCAIRLILLAARLLPRTICLGFQALRLRCASHIAFPGRHCPPACAIPPTHHETWSLPATTPSQLRTSNLNFS